MAGIAVLDGIALRREPVRITQHDGQIADVGIAIQRLRIGGGTGDGVGRRETAKAADVGAGLGVVVALSFVIAVVGREHIRRGGRRRIAGFSKWKGAALVGDVAAGVGADAGREVIVVPVVGGADLDAGNLEIVGVDVFVGGGLWRGTIVVFGKDLGAGEDGNDGVAATDFLNTLAVAVIGSE